MREVIIREDIRGWTKKEIKDYFDFVWKQDVAIKRILIDTDHFEIIYYPKNGESMLNYNFNPSRRKK